jgi:iron(III) transport system substrate-binding protein
MNKRRSFIWIGACLAVTLATLIFCSTHESSAAAPGGDSLPKLYEAARTEGKLLWQYLGAIEPQQPVVNAFNARFPGVTLTIFSLAATDAPTRIITESKAGRLSMDVSSQFPYFASPLLERDLLVKYDWTQLGISGSDIMLDGAFVSINDAAPVWVYNTNLVSAKEVPKTWDDLLAPKWKGSKISLRGTTTPFTPLFFEWRNNPQKVVDYLKKLQGQEVLAGKRNAEVAGRIANGECPIGSLPLSIYIDIMKGGAPVRLAPISPSAGSPSGVVIPKGAPHPNAAKLFIGWLFTPEARKILYEMGEGPATPCDASVAAKMLCENNIKFVSIKSEKDIEQLEGPFARIVLDTMKFVPK